jgi:hypothetical protein
MDARTAPPRRSAKGPAWHEWAGRLGVSPPAARDRTSQGRVKMAFAVKAANHAMLAVRAVGLSGRSRRWLGVAAVSIGADAVLSRMLDDPRYIPGWGQWALEWIDCGIWAGATEARDDVVPLLSCAAVPSTIISTFDAFAGTRALPVYNPGRPWPPAGADDALRRGLHIVVTTAVPVVIASIVRKRRGLPTGAENVIWTVAGASLAAFGARHRDRLHRGERQRWAQRTEAQVRQEFRVAEAELATSSTPGHDFKKTLFALGLYGSDEAMIEASRQAVRPQLLLQDLGGLTLFEVTRSTRITPPDAATLWVTPVQADRIRAFVRGAEDQAVDGADQSIRVRRPEANETIFEYLGQQLRLRNEPPPLRVRLDPSAILLALSAWLAIDTGIVRELPIAVTIPPAALLSAAAWRFWNRAPFDHEMSTLVRLSSTATAMGLVASASRLGPVVTPLGYSAFPASSFAKGTLTVLGAHWGRLSPGQRLLLPVVFIAWAAACLYRSPRTAAQMLIGALDLVQGMGATWRLSDLVDGEATHLETALQAEFSRTCEQARLEATRHELHRYLSQLRIARRALATLEDELEPKIHDDLLRDCTELARWLLERYRQLDQQER